MIKSFILSSSVFALLVFYTQKSSSLDQLNFSSHSTTAQQETKWVNLLAGNSLNAWHQYNGGIIKGWTVQNGILSTQGKNGDIVTNQEFDNFELEMDWKIEKAGNSGIFIYIIERPDYKRMYESGPEFQIIDNDNYPQQLTPEQKTGSMSDVLAPMNTPFLNSAGQWNNTRIISKNGHVQHWLNNKLLLEYQIGSPELKEQIAKSKFAEMPYAKTAKGKIGLQDHGDPVFYKNIRIRQIN